MTENGSEPRPPYEYQLEKIYKYCRHDDTCIRSFFEAGEPRSDGSYWNRFKGEWYQARPVDNTPKCECGLDDLVRTNRPCPKDNEAVLEERECCAKIADSHCECTYHICLPDVIADEIRRRGMVEHYPAWHHS